MNNIVIFESSDQLAQVRLEGETVWLTQVQMAELFETSTDNISLHLKNIYMDNELGELATTENFSVVLDVLLSLKEGDSYCEVAQCTYNTRFGGFLPRDRPRRWLGYRR